MFTIDVLMVSKKSTCDALLLMLEWMTFGLVKEFLLEEVRMLWGIVEKVGRVWKNEFVAIVLEERQAMQVELFEL